MEERRASGENQSPNVRRLALDLVLRFLQPRFWPVTCTSPSTPLYIHVEKDFQSHHMQIYSSTLMGGQYIGMDVHTATISAAVRDSSGNLVMEATLETKAETILEFVHGLRGSLHVSFEEGTCAAWLHDLLKPHVTEVLVCDSRKNALLRVGNKNDREDARKLSELLFLNKLHPVYHGETGIRTLKELARSYLTITRDLTRVMNRLKAIYRGWGIACAGRQVYAPRYRAEWLAKITEVGVRRRAEIYYQQFDALAALRQEVRRELLAESRKHPAMRLLRQIPSIGPIRAALLIALMQTPHRFRTKRQLWAYCGLALRTYDSGE